MAAPLIQLTKKVPVSDEAIVAVHPEAITSIAVYPSGTTIRLIDNVCYTGLTETPKQIAQMREAALAIGDANRKDGADA